MKLPINSMKKSSFRMIFTSFKVKSALLAPPSLINPMNNALFRSQSHVFRPKRIKTAAVKWVIRLEIREKTTISAQIAMRSERFAAVLSRIAIGVWKDANNNAFT